MKICGVIYVNETYTDRRINPHLGQLALVVGCVIMTAIILHNGSDIVIRLNLFEVVK